MIALRRAAARGGAAHLAGRAGIHPDLSAASGACDFFWEVFSEAEEEARKYAERGLLIIDNEGLKLTEQGIDISNSIMSLFV